MLSAEGGPSGVARGGRPCDGPCSELAFPSQGEGLAFPYVGRSRALLPVDGRLVEVDGLRQGGK